VLFGVSSVLDLSFFDRIGIDPEKKKWRKEIRNSSKYAHDWIRGWEGNQILSFGRSRIGGFGVWRCGFAVGWCAVQGNALNYRKLKTSNVNTSQVTSILVAIEYQTSSKRDFIRAILINSAVAKSW